MNAKVKEYIEHLQANLTRWESLLIDELRRIVEFRFHPEVDLLHFEFFDDSTAEPSFPFFLYAYRKKDGPQDYGTPMPNARTVFESPPDTPYFSGWLHLLDGHQQSLVETETWERYAEETDYEIAGPESDIIHAWFVECWKSMDGPKHPISTYLIRVYSDQADDGFDLRNLSPVQWADIWS